VPQGLFRVQRYWIPSASRLLSRQQMAQQRITIISQTSLFPCKLEPQAIKFRKSENSVSNKKKCFPVKKSQKNISKQFLQGFSKSNWENCFFLCFCDEKGFLPNFQTLELIHQLRRQIRGWELLRVTTRKVFGCQTQKLNNKTYLGWHHADYLYLLICWWCGVLMRWWHCVDVLMCWCVDVLMCWCVDVLMCWCVDVLMCWCVDVLMCWCVDVLCWCIGVLVCWCVDVLMC